MSIAKKLQTVADNVQKVYKAGYEKGKAEGGNGVDYLPYVATITFSNSSGISETTDDIVLNLENATQLSQCFFNVHFACNKMTLRISNKCTNLYRLLSYGSATNSGNLKEVEIVGNTENVANFSQTFQNRLSIERIIGELDFSNATNITNMLTQCQSLKEFYPKAGTIKLSFSAVNSPDLIDECIQAIVDGFSDMTGQTSPVLTVHPVVKAKIEANQTWLNTLINKNVTLA